MSSDRGSESLPASTAWNEPDRIRKATLLLSSVLYAALLFAMLDPNSMKQSEEVFGPAPLGLPLEAFVLALVTLVFIPLPLAFWHGYRIAARALSEGMILSKFNLIKCLFTTPSQHPDLRPSRIIVLAIVSPIS
jgi:hypothetical protein